MTKNSNTLVESPWWYKQVPRDFMSSPDVSMMTAEEIGAYFLLLQWEWLGGQDCTLPNDPERLAKLARVSKLSDIVLGKFRVDKQGRLYNPRLMEEWQQAFRRSKSAQEAIATRWEKRNAGDTGVLPPNYDSNTRKTKTQTKTQNNKKIKTVQTHTEALGSATDVASDSASSETPATGPGEAAVRVTAKLAAILGRDNLKPATRTAWAEQAEAIVAEYGEQTVLDVVTHHLVESSDGFWRGRVFAMKNLVRNFRVMHEQSKRKTAETSRKAANPLAARAASLQTGHDFSGIAKGEL